MATIETLQQIIDKQAVISLETFREGKTILLENIQSKLKDIGAYTFILDGLYGPRTEIALNKFCNAVFLDNMQTQLIGPTFAQKLLDAPPPSFSAGPGQDNFFIRPVEQGVVTSEFGYRIHPLTGLNRLHAGIDIGGNNRKPIFAASGGTVSIAGFVSGYGNFIEIQHNNIFSSAYAHMENFFVNVGDTVNQGDLIGRVGQTGGVTGPHLHFEILQNGSFINPRDKVAFPARGIEFSLLN
ncbi:M23 family metallopeptidase [Acaryochloris sp. CCMEE 5410]|uniref:M23 family metallopeptidase n=1 Tax=Acaryochloris sp. CCMEE 5410 TaxID=310037 RepID=UPI0002484530|nr:M23 family metallopeptidase [Acaryochloris sp. CCMEE 5410]KAI9134866.1 M23 family metallopeptidase [Acaryochloris sp. CCMEE 5410]